MLTPFDKNGEVDYLALEKLTEWYITHKVSGLFAVCQSSEMFCLSLEERMKVAETVVELQMEEYRSLHRDIFLTHLRIRCRKLTVWQRQGWMR